MHILLFIGCFFVVVLAGLLLGFLLPVRRSRRLEQKARQFGFRFSPRATPFQSTDVEGLTILQDHASTVVDNLLERSIGTCQFLVCDVCEVPVGDATAAPITTVAAFRLPSMHLPIFQLGEKNVSRRVIELVEHALGKEHPSLDTDQEFARNFFVQCSEKDKVNSFLTPEKLAYVRNHLAHYHVESSPDWLFVYRLGHKVEAENLKDFCEITSAIAAALLSIQKLEFPAVA